MRRSITALLAAVVGLSSLEAASPRTKAEPPLRPGPEALAASESYRLALAQVIQKRGADYYYLQGAGGPWAAGVPAPSPAPSPTAGHAKASDGIEAAASSRFAHQSGSVPTLVAAKAQQKGATKARLWDRLFPRRSSERAAVSNGGSTPDQAPTNPFAASQAERTVR